MLTNADMKPSRFHRWAQYRKIYAAVMAAFDAGKMVQIATYTRATRYTAKHRAMFKVTRCGVFVRRGKHWDDFSGCSVRAFRL